jgi:2-dehydro-3-deoxyphosphogluconate aldolase/(4S)-4-hydroxy-2-oxoglutarate aldolase
VDISDLENHRALVIIRHHKPFDAIGLLGNLREAGFPFVEISLNTPRALHLIKEAVRNLGTDVCIGAGTVLTMDQLKGSIDSGVRYIVSPLFDGEIVEHCVKEEIPVFPGALTPAEIYRAHNAGAAMVKVFPSSTVGPSYFRSIKAPMPDIKLLAVGGIRRDNISDYLSAGAEAVAIGSGIIQREWIDAEDYTSLHDALASVVAELIPFKR